MERSNSCEGAGCCSNVGIGKYTMLDFDKDTTYDKYSNNNDAWDDDGGYLDNDTTYDDPSFNKEATDDDDLDNDTTYDDPSFNDEDNTIKYATNDDSTDNIVVVSL